MSLPSSQQDQQRRRWRKARALLKLLDVEATDFGRAGLAAIYVERPTVRVLILPADPGSYVIDFDQEFWEWWNQPRLDPATGQRLLWGTESRPTAYAAVQTRERSGDRWRGYLALHRNGALEVELGDDGAFNLGNDQFGFRLTTMVGRFWAACGLYREVVDRFAVKGPWEVCLALQGTKGGTLGNFGEGWADFGDYNHPARPCDEPNLLFRHEAAAWPAADDDIQAIAFRFGAFVEDAWGRRERRYLAHRGERAGKFDVSRYR